MYFWVDEIENRYITYNQLISDLNNKNYINKYVRLKDTYSIYLNIICAMVLGCEITLLDSDFSDMEVKNLGINPRDIKDDVTNLSIIIHDFPHLLDVINKNSDKFSLTLFTSGTTGRPKKVQHDLNSLTRTVKKSSKFCDNVWGLAYNPTHFAGLQVFYQGFFNKNTFINIFNVEKNRVGKIIDNYKITNISATPTFYRTLLPFLDSEYECVKRITLGGERFDTQLKDDLMTRFPNAKITNVYASTEAGSLFGSNGEAFTIKKDIKDKIKISSDNELMIHQSLLGYSKEYITEDGWYNTGDIIEFIHEDEFVFVSRKTEMINIGGYKVNPHEIEEEIKKIDGVTDTIVKGRDNRITGKILVAEVSCINDVDKKELEFVIRKHLKECFQEWKVPRIIKFVTDIEKTRTGKKVRI